MKLINILLLFKLKSKSEQNQKIFSGNCRKQPLLLTIDSVLDMVPKFCISELSIIMKEFH